MCRKEKTGSFIEGFLKNIAQGSIPFGLQIAAQPASLQGADRPCLARRNRISKTKHALSFVASSMPKRVHPSLKGIQRSSTSMTKSLVKQRDKRVFPIRSKSSDAK